LKPGRNEGDGEPAEVYFYVKDEPPEVQDDTESEVPEEEGTEAQKVADLIKNLMRQTLTENGTTRPIRYKDIAVLLRSVQNTLPQWQEVFADNGIPLFAEGQKSSLDDPEVAVLLSLLRVMDNFEQDIPLISALRSGIFSFTEDDLLSVRLQGGNTAFFYQAFLNCTKGEAPLSLRCKQVLQTLGRYNDMAGHLAVDQLLFRILEERALRNGWEPAPAAGASYSTCTCSSPRPPSSPRAAREGFMAFCNTSTPFPSSRKRSFPCLPRPARRRTRCD
jgi:ATP-dependent helicase/nuclease subunit A